MMASLVLKTWQEALIRVGCLLRRIRYFMMLSLWFFNAIVCCFRLSIVVETPFYLLLSFILMHMLKVCYYLVSYNIYFYSASFVTTCLEKCC